jgi:hypothetical protein
MTKRPEDVLYELQKTVAAEFFKANPLKRFPDDFLTKKVKEEMRGEGGFPAANQRGKLPGMTNRLGVKGKRFPAANQVSRRPGMTTRKKKKCRKLATMYRSWPGGRSHNRRHRPENINLLKAMTLHEYAKKAEAKMAYKIIVLPEGKFELKIDKKIQIRPEKWPMPLEFNYFEAAKYVLYARKKGQCAYNLPKDESIVKKAVKKYETYLKKIRDKLVKAFMERNVDSKLAEGFTKLVFEEKLPFSHLAR